MLSYAIGGVLNQLILDDLGQWYLLAYYSHKMILAKTWYKTHKSKILAIVEAFKIWRHYLQDCKHIVFIFTNHNNLCHFIDIKSLSSHQVWWAQKLSCYYFQKDYRQSKANGTANTLSRFSQRNKDEKENLWAEYIWIFHYLQSSLTNASISDLNAMVLSLLF